MLEDKIRTYAVELKDYTRKVRTHLRENPELSGQEFKTAEYLKTEIKKSGFEIMEVEGTGFIAVLDTKKDGKTIGLRSDIDALPINESPNNLKGPKGCISKVKGKMHACGHDAHMAISLTSAKILKKLADEGEIGGRYLFLFEEGEEMGCGIHAMIDGLKQIDRIDAIYGNHIFSDVEQGKFGVEPGYRMAADRVIDFTVKGRGGHGSRPDMARNPLFAMVEILSSIATAWPNQLDVTKLATLGIAQVSCGTARNVFADTASCAGTVRFFEKEQGQRAIDLVKKVATHVGAAHDCTVEFSPSMDSNSHSVYNDPKLAEIAQKAVIKHFGKESLDDYVSLGSETFASYCQHYPCMFSFIGTKNEEKGMSADHHTEEFDYDVAVLTDAVILMLQFAIDFYKNNTDFE